MVAAATKENRKGSAHSYNYNRWRIVIICIVLFLSAALVFAIRNNKQSTITAFNDDGGKAVAGDRPPHRIEYGVQSTPLVMIRSSLDTNLYKRFLDEYLYSCDEEDLNHIQELDNRVNPPVYVYEGYYHSLRTNQNVFSRNPNPMIAKDFQKPAASPFTRAFFDAFRSVNKEIFDGLKHNLLDASSYNHETKKEDVCYLLAQWIERGHHFGDLSIQIHYGKGNREKLLSGAAWHTDAANSLLHFAVTLRGNRVLHSKRIQLSTESANDSANNRRPLRGQMPKEVLEEQYPGDVYLSSSTLMRHAPQFFDTDYRSRSIAIHARFLYTSEDINHFYNVRTKESWDKMTNVLATTLSTADIQIPSLEQVESQL